MKEDERRYLLYYILCLTYEVTLQIYNFFQCLFQAQLKFAGDIDLPFPLTKYNRYWTQISVFVIAADRSFFRVTPLVADRFQQFRRQDSGGMGWVDKKAILSQADLSPHLSVALGGKCARALARKALGRSETVCPEPERLRLQARAGAAGTRTA